MTVARSSRVLLGLLAAAAACRGDPADAPAAAAAAGKPRLALASCRLKDLDEPARCGTLEVFEDREAKTGRKISLFVAVVPALAASPEPDPVFVLAGGPGQSATEIAAAIFPAFERMHQSRDLVLLDQRGTGKSNPLDCELVPPSASLAEKLSSKFDEDAWKRCAEALGSRADPRFYTTPIAMDDLDDVREALGYSAINLWGVSYGTRAGLIYLRRHGEHARTAILDSVAPLSLVLPLSFSHDAQRALELLFSACAADAPCARAYPSLRERFEAFLARLKKEPLRARVPHPRTGIPEEVTLDFDTFTGTFRSILYSSDVASLLPWMLDRAEKGDLGPFVTAADALGFDKGMSLGMMFSVLCAEDAPLLSEGEIRRWTENTWLGDSIVREFSKVCAIWPHGQVAANYREPVSSRVPVLLLSGELDPVTPPSWAEEARKTLPNAISAVVPGMGHNTMGSGCVRRLMTEFVKKGSGAGLDTDCSRGMARPPFFISFAGPVP